MLPDTAASKVTAAHLSRTALLYVRQSSLKQVIHNTESAIRQYDLRGKAISLGWAGDQITVIDIDQGQSGASAADREGFQQMVAEVSLGRAGIVLGLECSRLARNSADWHQLLELCGMTGTLICDEDGLYDPRNFNDRLLLGIKGPWRSELHFIKARLRGGQLSKARRGELIMPLPVGLVYDAAGHVILDPDTAVRGALAHLFTTFEATGSATACVKAFRAAGLLFPWRHLKGPRKGETDWKPLAHHTVLRVLHNPRYAGCFTYGRHAHHKQPGGKTTTTLLPRQEWISFIPGAHPGYITLDQYDANLARLAANAAAHGRDRRRAAPRRTRAAAGHHHLRPLRAADDRPLPGAAAASTEVPTYICQRDGIENGRRACAVIPGAHPRPAHRAAAHRHPHPAGHRSRPAGLRRTPAASRRSRRAARRPRRARPLPRRPGPPPLPRRRPRQPARRRHPRSRLEHRPARPHPGPGRLRQRPPAAHRAAHRRPEDPDQPARHRPARHLERPRHPGTGTQAHRPAAAHRRHRHPHQRHHHRARPPGRRPGPHPHPPVPRAWETSAGPRPTSSPPSTSSWTTTPAPRSPASSTTAAWPAAPASPSTGSWWTTSSAPTSYAAAASGCAPPGCSPSPRWPPPTASSNNTIKDWCHAGIVTGSDITTKARSSTTRPTPATRPTARRPAAAQTRHDQPER